MIVGAMQRLDNGNNGCCPPSPRTAAVAVRASPWCWVVCIFFEASSLGCECDRCKWLVAYHREMNNDVMVAPETAYIVGAFFQDWKLPRDFALTVQDIPFTEALERIKEGCTTQEERFLRHMARRTPICTQGTVDGKHAAGTSEYARAQLYDEFKAWQADREPHVIHIRSEDNLVQKLGHLRLAVERTVPDALIRKEYKGPPKRRTWILHHAKLLEYFDGGESGSESEDEWEPAPFPDLDEMARAFVHTHLARRACEGFIATHVSKLEHK